MITECPKCKVPLVVGTAIESKYRSACGCWLGYEVSNADTLKLIECLKCPKCGYSDDGK